jgi:hypothetical protein
MKNTDFIDGIYAEVVKSTPNEIISLLETPPGRNPKASLLELANWFNGIPESDRKIVKKLLLMASRQATFGFLNVLDGTRSIEADGNSGHFELYHVTRNSVLLNAEDIQPLHELLPPLP